MAYQVTFKKQALKSFQRLPVKIQSSFIKSFQKIALNPYQTGLNLDIQKLQNREEFRLRIGGYRAIYRLIDDYLIIEVLKLGSRGDVYK
jgi:mRNA interferase RelE/StbE